MNDTGLTAIQAGNIFIIFGFYAPAGIYVAFLTNIEDGLKDKWWVITSPYRRTFIRDVRAFISTRYGSSLKSMVRESGIFNFKNAQKLFNMIAMKDNDNPEVHPHFPRRTTVNINPDFIDSTPIYSFDGTTYRYVVNISDSSTDNNDIY